MTAPPPFLEDYEKPVYEEKFADLHSLSAGWYSLVYVGFTYPVQHLNKFYLQRALLHWSAHSSVSELVNPALLPR